MPKGRTKHPYVPIILTAWLLLPRILVKFLYVESPSAGAGNICPFFTSHWLGESLENKSPVQRGLLKQCRTQDFPNSGRNISIISLMVGPAHIHVRLFQSFSTWSLNYIEGPVSGLALSKRHSQYK